MDEAPDPPRTPAGGGADRPPDVPALLAALRGRSLTVATAESLTAGAVAARLADVPGASAVLRGGVVAYATAVKQRVLGVDAGLLARGGPVQGPVAVQMASGAAALLGASVGVATTGVAGPGPADGHPAGTVVVAVAAPDGPAAGPGPPQEGRALVEEHSFTGDRAAVCAAAAAAALRLLARWVAGTPDGPASLTEEDEQQQESRCQPPGVPWRDHDST